MPRRRRRGAKAAAIEVKQERSLLMRILLHSPKDMVAGLLAAAAICAIVANALFLQAGRHPSPMFGSVVTLPAPQTAVSNPLPRPRPVELIRSADTDPPEIRPVEARGADPKSADPKNADPMTNLVTKSTNATTSAHANGVRPPAPIPVQQNSAARRVAAVQRALAEYGYGQLKVTGTIGGETQAAIQKFEREHKMPVTGQVSDRLLRELAAAIGHPVE